MFPNQWFKVLIADNNSKKLILSVNISIFGYTGFSRPTTNDSHERSVQFCQ